MPDFKSLVEPLLPELIAFRRDLHAHPELAFQEQRTSQVVTEALQDLPGLQIQNGLAGGTGVLATLNADKPGPCVLLRADMDALPLQEATGVPYQSRHENRMHACGHDGHTTCLLGAARVLCQMADQLPGKVKFCFQPAEEDGAGGERMIEDGVLEDPRVDAAFAMHGWPDIPLGQIIAVGGPMLAAATPFEIDLKGKGGHAAYPHRCCDVIAAAAQLIANAQAIRTRFVDPLDPLVLSFCHVDAGHAHNVLPSECHMKGTIRALSEKAQATGQQLLQQFLQSTAALFGVQAELRFVGDYPVLVNDKACAAMVADAARELLGDENVITDYPPGMGGEDFAFYARRVPAVMYRVGLRPGGTFEFPGLHNPRFNFNDDAIPIGVQVHCAVAHRYLTTHAAPSDEYII